MGPGENAGAVDVGDGLACAFKVESHNHPSAVEPFQGAATGVGGILRDIFALGARPIAVLDSLRFGDLDDSERSRYLLEHAVAGIGHYGNSIGVPTIGGEVYFEGPYEQNCLVNAMALGLAPRERADAAAPPPGVGNVVLTTAPRPAATGSAARPCWPRPSSARPTTTSARPSRSATRSRRSKLLECSLELLEQGLIVSLQDLGAAGLTSSASEMASKGEVGIDLDVARCRCARPTWSRSRSWSASRRSGCSASSSPESVDAVIALTATSGRSTAAIGEVTDTRPMRIYDGDELVGDMPVEALVDDCPIYDLAPAAADRAALRAAARDARRRRAVREALLELSASPNIASRRPLFEQYDSIVQSRTVRRPEEADAAVLALPDGAALAVSIDGNGRRVAADPYRGTRRRRARVRVQPGLRRRQAARHHQQPELRQPGEAARRLAADRGGARDRRRLPRARGADRRRQCLALQRGRLGTDLPDAGDRHGRPAARRRPAPGASVSSRRARRSRSSAAFRRRWPRASWRSCAASRCRTGCRSSRSSRPSTHRTRSASAVREGLIAQRARHRRGRLRRRRSPSAAWPARSARRSTSSRPTIRRAAPVRRGPGGLHRGGHPTALAQLAERIALDRVRRGRRRGAGVTIADESFEVPLDQLREAHDGLRRFFP